MKVLIAYDGSPCADAALKDLHRAGMQREVEALVITVAERWFPSFPVSSRRSEPSSGAGAAPAPEMAEDLKKANQLALGAKSQIESYFRDWKVQSAAAAGLPAQEILRIAAKWRPDLIVVGCKGCAGDRGSFPGSVSQKVLNEARCSVRVCKGRVWKNGAPVRMVIGLDGSPAADEAVNIVARRVWPTGSQVRLVAVVNPARSGEAGQPPDDSNGRISNWARQLVQSTETKLRAVGLKVSSRVEEGDPKQIIVIDAEEWGADCILIGAAASASPLSPLGDVATAVAARAHCSVEVIRQAGTA